MSGLESLLKTTKTTYDAPCLKGLSKGLSSKIFAAAKVGLNTRVVLIGLIKTTKVVLIRSIKGLYKAFKGL